MFYNLQRSTRAAREEAEKGKLTGVGHSVINPKEKFLNFQKRQKLKDLLITKFMENMGLTSLIKY
jgi:hypothetical protein